MKKLFRNLRDADWETIHYVVWYGILMLFLIAFTGGGGKK